MLPISLYLIFLKKSRIKHFMQRFINPQNDYSLLIYLFAAPSTECHSCQCQKLTVNHVFSNYPISQLICTLFSFVKVSTYLQMLSSKAVQRNARTKCHSKKILGKQWVTRPSCVCKRKSHRLGKWHNGEAKSL